MKGKKDAVGKASCLGSSSDEARIYRAGLRSLAHDVVLEAIAEEVTLFCGPKHAPASGAALPRGRPSETLLPLDGAGRREARGLAVLWPFLRRGDPALPCAHQAQPESAGDVEREFFVDELHRDRLNDARRQIGRVKRWRRETEQPERWLALALTEAEKGFRRVRNAGDMPRLREALRVDKGAAEDGPMRQH